MMFGFRKKMETIDFVATGCVDCGYVTARPKGEPKTGSPDFKYGDAAVKIWREPDNKHYLVIVSTRPERVFMSCQPPEKLLTSDGVAAILSLVANITESMEVRAV